MTQRTLPGYKLLYLLGRGQTALVHLAQDERGRQVALKVPLEETLKNQEAAERFGNEVRLSLQFRHPNVVPGYAGTAFGPKAFLALRYYPDGTLSDVLQRRKTGMLDLEETLPVLADVASGLTYLHALGAVHQDVKPQNVYVEGGRASLGDLSSAYFTAQGGLSSGSPFYMAPEIYHGHGSSLASDVYSLGVMAYELLSGRRPFQGTTYEELMSAHLNTFAPPLSHLSPEVPRPAARLLERALAKRPQDRPTANELRRELLAALGEVPEEEDLSPEPAAPVAASTPVGRHAPAAPRDSAATATPIDTAAERGGSRWNPFKRRK
ncbi:serine/threonine protein kinase [Deinococcus hopiensis KR-140]|uniref:Serine/threonine protein kinase n=2 Tax=Deinococcus TaxID=1298 RepID=A0A1W1V5N7_9DEIO|nr:serine/threonine protein kinase [Deinococcus hopiensis KR-140]